MPATAASPSFGPPPFFWSFAPSRARSGDAFSVTSAHPARTSIRVTNESAARRAPRLPDDLDIGLRICFRSRCGQFSAESRESLGYALGVIELFYEAGTLVATGSSRLPEPFVWDGRTRQWRAPANAYRETVLGLRNAEVPHKDRAAAFEKVPLESRVAMEPRPYQREALGAWRRVPRDHTPHRDDLRLGLHTRRTLRGPLRVRGLRRGPPPAGPEERHHPQDAPRPLRPWPHRHA